MDKTEVLVNCSYCGGRFYCPADEANGAAAVACDQEACQQADSEAKHRAAMPDEHDDRDQLCPVEYSESYDWSGHDFDSDPDWN